jgi:hypothetical protein
MHANAVILFAGDRRREESRKGLPPGFLRHLHAQIVSMMDSLDGMDRFNADDLAPNAESLGAKVSQAVARAWDRGYERVVLVAGDVAGLSRNIMQRALASSAAIGRSPDGGFYILTLTRRPSINWSSVRWGTCHAFDDVAAVLGPHDVLPELDDIDSLGDALRVLRAPRFASLYGCLQSLIRDSRFADRDWQLQRRAVDCSARLRAPPTTN